MLKITFLFCHSEPWMWTARHTCLKQETEIFLWELTNPKRKSKKLALENLQGSRPFNLATLLNYLNFEIMDTYSFFLKFTYLFWDTVSKQGRGRERERETENPNQPPHCQRRAQCRAGSHEPWQQHCAKVKSLMLNQLSHAGAPHTTFILKRSLKEKESCSDSWE